ncbi:sigma-70 family RNA polymerase sigma factor [Lysinibacillus fusiformis]|uniref:sigma-70 family RNA polymerase sigma factor n=1 Tax=Lysinibacillus fusiformis TaxID=28031 RepID=UPI00263B43F0|nr:sigma-70 family RNA polymerase sigma factor [Lysinibacillus fusiformis]MDC6267254.1 sigma-70 family RNA polymerase sigma factor [Lysinibacillus sphaericus]MDN4968312.1 sigma-70 family RNA polymerase sigma factor [Lysinibacillus fusiformis]MDN4968486.1 sigma-70 family RNA polymerase sigma factor [Lysinibacillus fusiformis]
MEKLTNEELVEYYQKEFDEMAIEELYKRNGGLIADVTKLFRNVKTISKEDAISDCYYAFIKAAKTFDVSKNNKFSTYCFSLMKNEILKTIKSAAYQKRDVSKYHFSYLNEKINEDVDASLIDILDASNVDVLHKKNFKYLHNAIDYAKSFINEKYHPYLLQLLFRETTAFDVAASIGISKRTVHYTVTLFREHIREYIYHYSSGEIVSWI